jgi:hypothetical protein
MQKLDAGSLKFTLGIRSEKPQLAGRQRQRQMHDGIILCKQPGLEQGAFVHDRTISLMKYTKPFKVIR